MTDPDEKPRDGGIPLPVEEWLRAARRRLWEVGVRRPLAWARGLWRDHFVANPLLRREAGFTGGRRWWRAPLVWGFAAAALPVLLRQIDTAWLWALWISNDHSLRGAIERMNASPAHLALSWLRWPAAWCIYYAVPAWLAAWAWGRDREPAMRDLIAVSPLTVRQLIGARTLLWLLPLILVGLVGHLLGVAAVAHHWFMALQDPLWVQQGGWLPPRETFGGLLLHFLFNRLDRWDQWLHWAGLLAQMFLLLGLATRLTLALFRPALSAVVAASFLLVLEFLINAGWGRAATQWWVWSFRLHRWAPSALFLILAIIVWWGLPRHVARVYGMGEARGT